jgi:uncharacterized protein YaaW (UPF0174 family)
VNGTSGSLLGAMRGPVLVITLGVLFAIDYAGGASVGRTWPALLIVVGLFKLAEHVAVKNS